MFLFSNIKLIKIESLVRNLVFDIIFIIISELNFRIIKIKLSIVKEFNRRRKE